MAEPTHPVAGRSFFSTLLDGPNPFYKGTAVHAGREREVILKNLLQDLRALGIELTADGDRLRIRAPKGVVAEEVRAEIAAKKADLLRLLRMEVVDGDIFPLTYAQQRMWFLAQLAPDSAAYNIVVAARMRGALDEARLGRALDSVVAEHDALRCQAVERRGEVQQRVAPAMHVPLTVRRVPDASDDALLALLKQEATRPFDLTCAPILHATLLCLETDDNVLVLTTHHFACDGWSLRIVLTDLVTSYLEDRPLSKGSPTSRYRSYVEEELAFLASGERARQLEFWQGTLRNALWTLDLPTDRPRGTTVALRGGRIRFELPARLCNELRAYSRARGATPFMVFCAAYALLLGLSSDQPEVCVGTAVSHRARPGRENLVGNLSNTVVLRLQSPRGATFDELVSEARETILAAFDHQDVPFENVMQQLEVPRAGPGDVLLRTMLVLHRADGASQRSDSMALEVLAIDPGTTRFDVSLELRAAAGSISGTLEYATDLFDEPTMVALVDRLQHLLQLGVTQPQAALRAECLMDGHERLRVLEELSGATVAASRSWGTVLARFASQVNRQPLATAIQVGDAHLTYLELDRRSTAVAGHLASMGIERGDVVGVSLGPSIDLVVATLAVMKAGAAYLPLDPSYPQARLDQMVEDARCRTIIAEGAPSLRFGANARLVHIHDASTEAHRSAPPPPSRQDVAYVIFTSGSTGRPKGVAVPHRGLANLVDAQVRQFAITPSSRVLQFAPFSFDASVSEIFTALCAGAALVFTDRDRMLPGEPLTTLLADQCISVATLPPSTLTTLTGDSLPSLTTLVVAGEACAGDLVRKWAGDRNMVNAYGPTECSVCATMGRVAITDDPPPIGTPLPGQRVYIVDAGLSPVPPGVPGDLHVGGVGVAYGYVNRQELTAARFWPDPHETRPGARMYFTGDRALFLRDGRVAFLGRADAQVKVRGFRVELEEVEAAIRRVVSGCDVAVTAVEGPSLHAFLSGSGGAMTLVDLRRALVPLLPGYMIPTGLTHLAAIPKTPSNKVDRKGLTALRTAPEQAPTVGIPSDDRLRSPVRAAWARTLGHSDFGDQDDFFDVGGHSLLALKLLANLNEICNGALSLPALMTARTVAAQATRIGQKQSASSSSVVVLRASPGTSSLALVHALSGELLPYDSLCKALPQADVVGLQPPNDIDPSSALSQCVDRYALDLEPLLRSRGLLLCGWSAAGLLALRIAERLRARGHTSLHVLLLDPHLHPATVGSRSDEELLPAFLAELARVTGTKLAPEAGTWPADRALALAAGALRTEGFGAMDEAFLARRYAIAKALAGLTTAAPPARLDVPVTVLFASRSQADRSALSTVSEHLDAGEIEADHHGILREPAVGVVAAAIAEILGRMAR
jgi:amino acid adenylation domain-containing protein